MPSVFKRFRKDEDGGFTTFGVFMTFGLLLVGGLAVDLTYAGKVETELQGTADAAAHAALVSRQTMTADEARAVAMGIVERTLPVRQHGTLLTADDIRFGIWNARDRVFQADANAANAVEVTLTRSEARNNPVATFLLKLIGHTGWDISRTALYARGLSNTHDPCLSEGLMAEGFVDLQSNNSFYSGFCIYGHEYVSFRNNNYFAAGTQVSMPDLDDLDIASSGYRKNPGLENALLETTHHLDVQAQAEGILAGLMAGDAAFMPSYIHVYEPSIINGGTITQGDLTFGAVHIANCDGGGTVSIPNNTTLSNAVILTDCMISVGKGVALDNVILGTTSRSDVAVTSASSFQVGAGEDCTVDGNANVIALGGMRFAAKLSLTGGQLIAGRSIKFAAQGNVIMGASVLAGGNIDGTSNTQMGYCGAGMTHAFTWPTTDPVFALAG